MENQKSDNFCHNPLPAARYISGKASEAEKEAFEAHIASCDACLEDFIEVSALLRDESVLDYRPVSYEFASDFLENLGLCRLEKPEGRGVLENISGRIKEIYNLVKMTLIPLQPVTQRSLDGAWKEGSVATPPLVKDFDDFRVEICLERHEGQYGDITVTIPRGADNIIRMTLVRDTEGGEDEDSRPMKGDSEVFEFLEFGVYHIHFSRVRDDQESIRFSIDESGPNEK